MITWNIDQQVEKKKGENIELHHFVFRFVPQTFRPQTRFGSFHYPNERNEPLEGRMEWMTPFC